MTKIGAIIPIRLASERLPNKALMPMVGRPVVWHLLDRICASRFIKNRKDVVVCTTMEASDDPLVESVERYGCSVYRGSTDDIIKRFYDAMEAYSFEAVIQVDGDDPLSDTQYMDMTMEKLLSEPDLGIVTCEGLPLGVATKSFTRKAMDSVYKHYKTEKNDTGFIYYFIKTGLCKHAVVRVSDAMHRLDEARLTLDYQEDLDVFRMIFEALYNEQKLFGLSEVVAFLKSHPEIMKINNVLNEEYWKRTNDKVNLAFKDDAGVIRQVI